MYLRSLSSPHISEAGVIVYSTFKPTRTAESLLKSQKDNYDEIKSVNNCIYLPVSLFEKRNFSFHFHDCVI